MYNNIIVPVDFGHEKILRRVLETLANIAGYYRTRITNVFVTNSAPGFIAHSTKKSPRIKQIYTKSRLPHIRQSAAKQVATLIPPFLRLLVKSMSIWSSCKAIFQCWQIFCGRQSVAR
ncbi:MAG: hypothetical protein ACI9RO_001225 [Alteromonas macleodii]|jgi:hypothetical protein